MLKVARWWYAHAYQRFFQKFMWEHDIPLNLEGLRARGTLTCSIAYFSITAFLVQMWECQGGGNSPLPPPQKLCMMYIPLNVNSSDHSCMITDYSSDSQGGPEAVLSWWSGCFQVKLAPFYQLCSSRRRTEYGCFPVQGGDQLPDIQTYLSWEWATGLVWSGVCRRTGHTSRSWYTHCVYFTLLNRV